jgi:hypothetical protein
MAGLGGWGQVALVPADPDDADQPAGVPHPSLARPGALFDSQNPVDKDDDDDYHDNNHNTATE